MCSWSRSIGEQRIMADIYEALKTALIAEQPVALVTLIGGGKGIGAKLLAYPDGTILGASSFTPLEREIARDALEMLARAESGIRTYATPSGDLEVFIESYAPPPTMFIIGAVHIAIPLVTFAKTLSFRTVVVDARGVFATPERFAHADELINAWPDEVLKGRINNSSFIVLLTHDPKLDDPALKIALPSPARYIGALGSPKTHAKRLARLREGGVPEEQLTRIHAPIGLAIGATTPEEIAVSIIAEIVAVQRGQTGREK